MTKLLSILILLPSILSCSKNTEIGKLPWAEHGKLIVHEGSTIIQYDDGTPFLWLGCTAWGMTEWMSREEVELYLDDRRTKGMNVVQFCVFWGKREERPVRFTANAPNYYGYKAFLEKDGLPDPLAPDIRKGGTPDEPNDYWDHVDFCINAIKKRGMYAAVLPFWGRRYVNASHPSHSEKIFTLDNIFEYGYFLGKRYGSEPNIIWVNGGDVKADDEGDHRQHYRLLAEGLIAGVTGKSIKWNQEAEEWDDLLITYHPDGSPMLNSSQWFHSDVWLDFNMIETHIHRTKVVASIRQDLEKIPLKPTVLGEGHYEGVYNKDTVRSIHIRRQAYQTFFAGGSGHTYGGSFDEQGNGPLFSVAHNWQPLLDWEGAGQLIYLKQFLNENKWWTWEMIPDLIRENRGDGELEKLAVNAGNMVMIYFPENSYCKITDNVKVEEVSWYNTKTGTTVKDKINVDYRYTPPVEFEDGILILKYSN